MDSHPHLDLFTTGSQLPCVSFTILSNFSATPDSHNTTDNRKADTSNLTAILLSGQQRKKATISIQTTAYVFETYDSGRCLQVCLLFSNNVCCRLDYSSHLLLSGILTVDSNETRLKKREKTSLSPVLVKRC